MDLGKLKLGLGNSYQGAAEAALRDVFSAFTLLQKELLVLPGVALIEASAVVSIGKAINITSGKVKHADAATNLPAVGICLKGAAIGQKATVLLGMGYAGGLSGLTANSSIYLGNAGALVFVKPGAGFIQGLGYSLSATEMFVTISQP